MPVPVPKTRTRPAACSALATGSKKLFGSGLFHALEVAFELARIAKVVFRLVGEDLLRDYCPAISERKMRASW